MIEMSRLAPGEIDRLGESTAPSSFPPNTSYAKASWSSACFTSIRIGTAQATAPTASRGSSPNGVRFWIEVAHCLERWTEQCWLDRNLRPELPPSPCRAQRAVRDSRLSEPGRWAHARQPKSRLRTRGRSGPGTRSAWAGRHSALAAARKLEAQLGYYSTASVPSMPASAWPSNEQ